MTFAVARTMRLAGLTAVIATMGLSSASAQSVTVKFNNVNPIGPLDITNTYVTFAGAGTGLTGTIVGTNTAIQPGSVYPMLSVSQGVTITNCSNLRICISFEAGLTANAANNYSPNFANPSLADYDTRWDKIEMTWTAGAGGANLTAQDFFGIPLQIATSGGGVTPTTLTWNTSTANVMTALGAQSSFGVNGGGGFPFTSTNAIVLGNYPPAVPISGGGNTLDVIRVISPATVSPIPPNSTTVYPSFASYVAYLQNFGGMPLSTNIAGNNGMGPNTLMQYDFAATIQNAAGIVGGSAVATGDLVFTGTLNYGDGTGNVATTFVVAASDLNDYAIYGANIASPPAPTGGYTLTQGTAINAAEVTAQTNMIVRALADYLAGMNFGLVGSAVIDPNTGLVLGTEPSYYWYGNQPTGDFAKLSVAYTFGFAQPNNYFYNQFAAYLTTVSGAYGFAYNDRLQSPFATLAAGSTLTITVLKDGAAATNGAGGLPIPPRHTPQRQTRPFHHSVEPLPWWVPPAARRVPVVYVVPWNSLGFYEWLERLSHGEQN